MSHCPVTQKQLEDLYYKSLQITTNQLPADVRKEVRGCINVIEAFRAKMLYVRMLQRYHMDCTNPAFNAELWYQAKMVQAEKYVKSDCMRTLMLAQNCKGALQLITAAITTGYNFNYTDKLSNIICLFDMTDPITVKTIIAIVNQIDYIDTTPYCQLSYLEIVDVVNTINKVTEGDLRMLELRDRYLTTMTKLHGVTFNRNEVISA